MVRLMFKLILIAWVIFVLAKIVAPLIAGSAMFGVYVLAWMKLRKAGSEREGMIAGAVILAGLIAAGYFADMGILKNIKQYHNEIDKLTTLLILGQKKGLQDFLAIQIKYWPYVLIKGFVLSLTVIPIIFGYYYWKHKKRRERLKERQNICMTMNKQTEQKEPALAGIREIF